MFGPVLPLLAESQQVIAVDLHGHGRTSLGDRPISLEDMGDDMAVIVKALGYDRVDAMGDSLGAGVAFRFAVQHPEVVRRLVLVSCSFATDGLHPEMRPTGQAPMSGSIAEAMKEAPMYQTYMAVSPHPEDFPRLLDRMVKHMAASFDYSRDVMKLKMPVMLVYGDSDMFTSAHMAEFYNLLGGNVRDAGWQRENMSQNRLAILPDHTHHDIFFSPELATTVLPFLNGEHRTQSWEDLVQRAD
jgi:pimeloyl-ACP methyl ester carboxylesterase